MNVDEWFKQIREEYSGHMQCGRGCTECCYGLFDITLADAVNVARGFEKLPGDVRRDVYSRAEEIHRGILSRIPNQTEPTLFTEDDPLIDEIVDAANSPRCPLLGENGACRIYDHRPLACRLEGVPMVDTHGRLFGDWCELNFKEGIPEPALADLKLDYAEIDAAQEAGSAKVAAAAGLQNPRALTFIPSVIVEYSGFWRRLLA